MLATTRFAVAGARCPICGEFLSTAVWTCERCRAPHHEDCARYFGGCAIFGCRDGAPPARIEQRLWPKVVSRLQWLTRIRNAESSVLTACVLGPLVSVAGLVMLDCGVSSLGALLAGAGLTMLVGFGALYLLLDVVASEMWRLIRRDLEKGQSDAFQLSSSRVREVIPRMQVSSAHSRFLCYCGLGTAGLAVLLAIVSSVAVLPVLGFIAGMLWTASRQLDAHRQQLDLSLNRFAATFSPLLEKGGGKPDPLGS